MIGGSVTGILGDGPGTCGLASVISPTCSGRTVSLISEAGNSVGDGLDGCEMT